MLLSDANKLTSTKIRELLPDFIDAEYPAFVQFLRAYYEWMEQASETLGIANRLVSYRDIDSTLDEYVQHFRAQFLTSLPADAVVSPERLAVYVRELYRAKGSPDAYRLLFRLVFDKDIDLFFPRENILRASDGIWTKEVSLKVGWCPDAEGITGQKIRGITSGATARVEYVNEYFDGPLHVLELFLNKDTISGTFQIGEEFETVDDGQQYCLPIYGCITGLTINNPGLNYQPDDRLIFAEGLSGGNGFGAAAKVRTVGSEAISSIRILDPGAGYVVGDVITFDNSGTGGNGAAAVVSSISPGNLLFEDGDTILFDHSDGITYAASLEDTTYYFATVPLSPFNDVLLDAADYDTVTNHDLATANLSSILTVTELSTPIDFGSPAQAYGKITGIEMLSGGAGYKRRPVVTVENSTAIAIETTDKVDIYTPAVLEAVSGAGQVKTIRIENHGVGYTIPPSVSLALSGDGTAEVTAEIGALCEYEGRYIDTRGRPSSDKKLQDANFYQPYSYVIKVEENIARYRTLVKKLLHPAGSVFFGEYATLTEVDGSIIGIISDVERGASDTSSSFVLALGDVSASANSIVYLLEYPLGVVANNAGQTSLYQETLFVDALWRTANVYFEFGRGYCNNTVAVERTRRSANNLAIQGGGGVTFTSGPGDDANVAIRFNGTTTFANVAIPPFDPTTPITLEAWVKINVIPGATQEHTLWGEGNSSVFRLSVAGDSKFYFYVGNGTNFLSSNTISTGQWYHIVGTWDGTNGASSMKLYVDGALANSKTSAVATVSNTSPMEFRLNSLSLGSTGNVDFFQTALYFNVLSANAIASRQQLGRKGQWGSVSDVATYTVPDMIYLYANTPIENVWDVLSEHEAEVLDDIDGLTLDAWGFAPLSVYVANTAITIASTP